VLRSGGTDHTVAPQAVSTSYICKTSIRETDPATGAPLGRGEQPGNLDGGRLMTVARLTQASVEVLG
jgi:hypothetical protein